MRRRKRCFAVGLLPLDGASKGAEVAPFVVRAADMAEAVHVALRRHPGAAIAVGGGALEPPRRQQQDGDDTTAGSPG